MLRNGIVAASIVTLAANCAPPVDEKLISYFGAPEENMAEARNAADICLKNSIRHREPAFRQAGYVDAMFENPERDVAALHAVLLIQPDTEVVVQLGKRGSKGGCIVGVKGMSPQQSYDLALPWVRHFNGVTNADLGQGLTPNAIQAWRDQSSSPPVFIAAYKTWDVLEAPGAAIRLSQ